MAARTIYSGNGNINQCFVFIRSQQREKGKEIVNSQIKELTGKALAKEILDAAFSRVIVTNDPMKESIVDFVRLSVNAGFIKTAPDLTGLFNFTILNKVLTEKGLPEIGK